MKTAWILTGLVLVLATTSVLTFVADKPQAIDLWPGKPPGEVGAIGAEKEEGSKPGEKPVKRVTNITKPTLTIYRPAKDKDTGAAVVICPGGGYHILAWDLEGEEVAAWLNSIGVTGIVLKYRVPRRPGTADEVAPPQAQMDVQRAVSLVRSHAKEWGIDPKRIGLLGFSAGGHLTAWGSTNYDKRSYEKVDAVDEISCRPDFSVLIYPWRLANKDKTGLNPDIRVDGKTPPMFLAHAGNDPVPVEHSVIMYLALKKAEVPADLHVYATGGHGFGLRPSDDPCSTWPQRCEEWMRSQKIIAKHPKSQ